MSYTKEFAKIYDKKGWAEFSYLVFKKFKNLIKGKKRLLDAACGTGTFARLISKYIKVDAYDKSEAMLKIARVKTKKVKFFKQDLIKYSKKDAYDVITCFYNSINHLNTRLKWQKTFNNFYISLKPNGILIFDINTIKALKYWSKINEKKGKLIRKGFSNKKQTAGLVIYYKNKVISMVNEIAFKVSEVKQMLKKAGFKQIITESDKKGKRVFFIVKRI